MTNLVDFCTPTQQKYSQSINHTCSKCPIYGEIIKSRAMMGIEIFKYRGHTVLVLTLVKEFPVFNQVLIF